MTTPADLVLLGEGPAASVYTGGDGLAIKVFPGSLDRETRAAFDHERSKLRHVPSILHIEDIQELPDGRIALLMARCAQSLTGLVGEVGGLSAEDTLAVGGAVTTALAAAHRAGVVHGGLSPNNVLLRTTGEPVVADFGLALRHRFADSTVDYAAPETLRTGLRDERSDLYGLGAVLYFALTGSSPFPAVIGERPGARILRVLGEPAPPIERPDVPTKLVTFIDGLLAKDPSRRPSISEAADLLAGGEATLDPALLGEPIVEIGPSSVDPRRLRARHVSALAIAGGVAALVLARLLLFGDAPPPSPTPPPPTTSPPILLELNPPIDHDDFVELSWRAPDGFYFSVLIEGEDKLRIEKADFKRSLTIPVEPGRKYCFQLQATDPTGTLTSKPQPLRGAECRP
ncbi:Serine/threonine protein kinase [Amycolatopsis xylanica]|uniref:non-specific serine/threonine protein kinase n=1 Tax=Amycolatopsis xylanica TaxID=589385 RepID=A0A1H2S2E6_9PSEU|nr:serine/threonine-protein kinase [Amycolatopsis xylanica]SDW25807.1 Serine/threonine protein kinase [Amycolatopsis xylanica]